MLLDTIFAPFVKERPLCVMARAVLERLLDAQRLNDLFACTSCRIRRLTRPWPSGSSTVLRARSGSRSRA